MSALNSALRSIGGSYALDYSGGYIGGLLLSSYDTTVNILNDDVITLGVAAVAVNGKPVIAGSVDTRASSLLIDYGNKIYQGKAPCFMYGGFQTMSSRSPSRGCNPDKTKVTVKASALKSAVEGNIVSQLIRLNYITVDEARQGDHRP